MHAENPTRAARVCWANEPLPYRERRLTIPSWKCKDSSPKSVFSHDFVTPRSFALDFVTADVSLVVSVQQGVLGSEPLSRFGKL
jgi:hypothetical protein